jgi:Na+/pantothenate symporter
VSMNQWARKRSAENIKVDFLCQRGANAALVFLSSASIIFESNFLMMCG